MGDGIASFGERGPSSAPRYDAPMPRATGSVERAPGPLTDFANSLSNLRQLAEDHVQRLGEHLDVVTGPAAPKSEGASLVQPNAAPPHLLGQIKYELNRIETALMQLGGHIMNVRSLV